MRHSSGLVEVLLTQAAPKHQVVKPRPAAKRKAPTQNVTSHATVSIPVSIMIVICI